VKRNLLVAAALLLSSVFAAAQDGPKAKHVLLITVDGLHALDVANYVNKFPKSATMQQQPLDFFSQQSPPGDMGLTAEPLQTPAVTGL
jgi:hypothetical protein